MLWMYSLGGLSGVCQTGLERETYEIRSCYLTKPFDPQILVEKLQKLTNPGICVWECDANVIDLSSDKGIASWPAYRRQLHERN